MERRRSLAGGQDNLRLPLDADRGDGWLGPRRYDLTNNRRQSRGGGLAGARPRPDAARDVARVDPAQHEPVGNIIDYPGNPLYRPRVEFKMAQITGPMQERQEMLQERALLVTEEGPVGLTSRRELVDVIQHYFGISRYELQVHHTYPEPFIIMFNDSSARDRVYLQGFIRNGPIELRFHPWTIDLHGDRSIIPYHVKPSLEGLPQHAWFQEVAEKVLCDECVIHHVDDVSQRWEDQRVYVCWGFAQDPTRIPQLVYLSLTNLGNSQKQRTYVSFVRPCNVKGTVTYRVLIHLDYVEDLFFYQHPTDELRAEGRVPFREFVWEYGRADGDFEDEDPVQLPRHCNDMNDRGWIPREEDDEDRDRGRRQSRQRDLVHRVTRCFDARGKHRGRS